MNKKGGATDIIIYMVITFVFIIFIGLWIYGINLFVGSLRSNMNSFVNPAVGLNQTDVEDIFNNTIGSLPTSYLVVRWISFMIIIFQAFALILGGLFVRVWKGFFPIFIILAAICVIISVPLSNSYEQLYYNPTFGPTFATLVGPSWILLHFPIWITIISLFSGIIMFISLPRNNNDISGYGYGGSII